MKKTTLILIIAGIQLLTTGSLWAQWQNVGDAGFSAGTAEYITMAIDNNDGTPYVAYSDIANSDKATCMKYNGTSWEIVGTAGFSPGGASKCSMAIAADGTPYVTFIDHSEWYAPTCMKLNGSSWEIVGSAGFASHPITSGLSMAIAANDEIYVAYDNETSTGGSEDKAQCKKFNGSTWELVGNATFSGGSAYYISIAMDGNMPYVAYRDGGNYLKATCKKYDGSSWVTVGTTGFSTGETAYISLAMSGSTPYVAYKDNAYSDKATCMTYNGTTWINVGTAGFSSGAVNYTSLAMDGSAPYIAYSDNGNSDKATCMTFNGINWVNVGVAGFSEGSVDYVSLVFNGNTPYVAYQDNANSNKVSCMMFPSSLTWTGSTSNDWNISTNWNMNEIPDALDNVVVSNTTNYPVISPGDDATCNNLALNIGTSLTVESDATGTGSLLIKGGVINSGTINFERYIDTYLPDGKWHYVSAPLFGQNLNAAWLSSNSIQQYNSSWQLFRWDEPTNYWINFASTGSPAAFNDGQFVSGRAYGLSRSSNGVLNFTGNVVTVNVPYSTTYNSGQGDGFNLIGNPFTCSIGITSEASSNSNFLSDNALLLDPNYAAIYIWNEAAGFSSNRNDYNVICNTGYSGFGSGSAVAQDYVQPGQGFMVKVASSQTLVFTAGSRVHSHDNYYKDGGAHKNTWPGLELILTKGEQQNSTIIAFHDNMTIGLDPTYDAAKIKGNQNISLSTCLVDDNGLDFAVQALPLAGMENLCIRLVVDMAEEGISEFSLEHELQDQHHVFLEDRQQQSLTNLKKNNYTTLIEEGVTNDRFFLHFREITDVDENISNKMDIGLYNYKGILHIVNPENYSGTLYITNLFGQQLMQKQLSRDSKQEIRHNLRSGYYIVSIKGNKAVMSKKVLIQN